MTPTSSLTCWKLPSDAKMEPPARHSGARRHHGCSVMIAPAGAKCLTAEVPCMHVSGGVKTQVSRRRTKTAALLAIN